MPVSPSGVPSPRFRLLPPLLAEVLLPVSSPQLRARAQAGSVLLVEDNDDIRTALADFLSDEGFRVTAVPTAEAGLEALHAQAFCAVLADHWLPRGSGGWLLETVRREGLADDTVLALITADPSPPRVEGVSVFHKPVDLEVLLALLAPCALQASAGGRARGGHAGPRVRWTLYVAGASVLARRALRNVQRVLEDYGPGEVALEVVDLATAPLASFDRQVPAVTPALVQTHPTQAVLLGDLAQAERAVDLLDAAGARRRNG